MKCHWPMFIAFLPIVVTYAPAARAQPNVFQQQAAQQQRMQQAAQQQRMQQQAIQQQQAVQQQRMQQQAIQQQQAVQQQRTQQQAIQQQQVAVGHLQPGVISPTMVPNSVPFCFACWEPNPYDGIGEEARGGMFVDRMDEVQQNAIARGQEWEGRRDQELSAWDQRGQEFVGRLEAEGQRWAAQVRLAEERVEAVRAAEQRSERQYLKGTQGRSGRFDLTQSPSIFAVVPTTNEDYAGVFGRSASEAELRLLTDVRKTLSTGTPRVHLAGSEHDAAAVRQFLESSPSDVVILIGHNENGQLRLPNGRYIPLTEMARELALNNKVGVFLSCDSAKNVSRSQGQLGTQGELNPEEATCIAKEVEAALKDFSASGAECLELPTVTYRGPADVPEHRPCVPFNQMEKALTDATARCTNGGRKMKLGILRLISENRGLILGGLLAVVAYVVVDETTDSK